MRFAASLCFLGVIVAAILHLLFFCLFDLHLSGSHVGRAFGLGAFVGIFIATFGAALKQRLSGIIVGASVCYLLAIGYIVLWAGIPIEWIY